MIKKIFKFTFLILLIILIGVGGYVFTRDGEDVKKLIVKGLTQTLNREVSIDGPLSFNWSLTPTVEISKFRISNPEWLSSEKTFFSFENLKFKINLLSLVKGKINLEFADITKLILNLVKKDEKSVNWVFPKSEKQTQGSKEKAKLKSNQPCYTIPQIKNVNIKNANFVYKDLKSNQPIRVALKDVKINKNESKPLNFNLNGSLNDSELKLKGLTDVKINGETGSNSFAIDILSSILNAKIKSTLRTSSTTCNVNFKLDISGNNLSNINRIINLSLPAYGPYEIKADLAFPANEVDLKNIEAKIGKTDLEGDLNFSSKLKQLKVNLKSNQFALNDFTISNSSTKGDRKKERQEEKKSKYIFTEDELPLKPLTAINLDISLDTKKFVLSKDIVFAELLTTLKTKSEEIKFDIKRAKLKEGAIKLASVVSDLNSPKYEINSEIKQIKLERLINKEKMLEAKADSKIKLISSGKSLRDFASNLNGTLNLVVKKGRFENTVLKVLTAGLGDILNPIFKTKENNKLHCIVAAYDIEDGVMKGKEQLVHASSLAIIGKGKINLKDEKVKLLFNMKSSEPALSALLIPFTVKGKLKKPKILPSLIGAVVKVATAPTEIGKSVIKDVEEVVDTIVGDSEEAESELCKKAYKSVN